MILVFRITVKFLKGIQTIFLFQLSLLEYEEDGTLDQTSIIPMVDGGTEGKTQENLNSQGNCFECEKLSFVIVNCCCSNWPLILICY